MDKKNIGILFPASKKFGGTFQYALSIAGSLLKYSKNYDYTLIYYEKDVPDLLDHNKDKTASYNSVLLSTEKTSLPKKIALFANLITGKKIFNAVKNDEAGIIKKYKIDLLVIPFPSLFGYRNEIPYIITIPDIMHKYFPKLPEYPFRARLRRDIEYTNAARYSVLTVGDSNQGIEDIHNFLKIPVNKCRIIYYVPPGYIYENKDMDITDASKLLSKYNLPSKYLFYPAQFWSHKNHARLVRALSLIKESKGAEIPLILTGSPQESFNKIMNLIKELKLSNQVLHLGYVSGKEIVALYKKSYALVFPGIVGPTNIPPLEAIVLGTSIICSNSFGMPEQIADAGLLFDPYDIEDMAEKIYRLWNDPKLREKLINNGKKIAEKLNFETYAKNWENIISEALNIISVS